MLLKSEGFYCSPERIQDLNQATPASQANNIVRPEQNEQDFLTRLSSINTDEFKRSLTGIKRGVEREALRVNPQGGLATTAHQEALGAPLSHETITTDFSEALLEFITPPETSVKRTLSQLADIHKYVQQSIGEERLWPLSMPCFVSKETAIPIARYGTSNVAQMKEVYRKGLHNRYGSMMQVIAGVHFNWSLPDEFWQLWCQSQGVHFNKGTVSNAYFDLIRNFKRLAWLVPYLYGASPALCKSFLAGKEQKFDFKLLGKGTLYLPYATSLRMSDLGYTNSEQSALNICYNDLDSYVKTVRAAINTPSESYAKFASGENGEWQQLNANVLQIENELYSPIRPKQVAKSLEKPSDALADRGVSYIEVRALDVNPFSSIGIKSEQFYFLDVFLLYCLLTPSQKFEASAYAEANSNLTKVVLEGRKPGLLLLDNSEEKTLQIWGRALFEDFALIAKVLDEANGTDWHSEAVKSELEKINNPDLTPSARWLNELLTNNVDNSSFGLLKAAEYKAHALEFDYLHLTKETFEQQAKDSIAEREAVEASDSQDFASFIKEYFAQANK